MLYRAAVNPVVVLVSLSPGIFSALMMFYSWNGLSVSVIFVMIDTGINSEHQQLLVDDVS
jgi:hypothetical protein